jgi:hypothetical protein
LAIIRFERNIHKRLQSHREKLIQGREWYRASDWPVLYIATKIARDMRNPAKVFDHGLLSIALSEKPQACRDFLPAAIKVPGPWLLGDAA